MEASLGYVSIRYGLCSLHRDAQDPVLVWNCGRVSQPWTWRCGINLVYQQQTCSGEAVLHPSQKVSRMLVPGAPAGKLRLFIKTRLTWPPTLRDIPHLAFLLRVPSAGTKGTRCLLDARVAAMRKFWPQHVTGETLNVPRTQPKT